LNVFVPAHVFRAALRSFQRWLASASLSISAWTTKSIHQPHGRGERCAR
jgi:hypothetical protein